MQTSYFAKHRNKPHGVCIAAGPPPGFKGRTYLKLAPKKWFLYRYKKDNNEKAYIKAYEKEVLDKLDPQEVYNDLGNNAVLLCWEGSGKFCHRHLVSTWLNKALNIHIKEIP